MVEKSSNSIWWFSQTKRTTFDKSSRETAKRSEDGKYFEQKVEPNGEFTIIEDYVF